MEDYRLELITPIGLITREKNREKSTLDLAICTPGLASRITHQVLEGFHGSDHRPLETVITGYTPEFNQLPSRRCWKKLNREKLQELAQQIQEPGTNLAPDEIDLYVFSLIQQLQDFIRETVPIARPS